MDWEIQTASLVGEGERWGYFHDGFVHDRKRMERLEKHILWGSMGRLYIYLHEKP